MAWAILIISGMFEAVWAAALSASQGFRRLWPSVLFVVALAISMAGLGIAMNTLPVGTAYAVWSGTGAVLAVLWGFATKQEPVTVARVLLLAGLVGSIVGLKVVS